MDCRAVVSFCVTCEYVLINNNLYTYIDIINSVPFIVIDLQRSHAYLLTRADDLLYACFYLLKVSICNEKSIERNFVSTYLIPSDLFSLHACSYSVCILV